MPFLGEFSPKNRNCEGTCRTQWRCSFSLFSTEVLLFGKFSPVNQNCQFKLKFGTSTNLNIQNSMEIITFSGFDQKYLFWVNMVQKFKIVQNKI